MSARSAVGERIRTLRTARGWTQAALAARLGQVGMTLSQSNLARLESGERNVTLDDLYGVALALDCPPLALLAPGDGTPVKVGTRGESPARLRAWFVGRQPLDTVRDHGVYREHVGRLREPAGMTLGPFLREVAGQLDADDLDGQAEIIRAAQDYLRGAARAVRVAQQRQKG